MSNLQNISFRQLRIFKKLCETKNMARTADSFALSAPAVSLAIKAIETQLGFETIRRIKGEELSLTPYGEELYEYAAKLEGLSERFALRLDNLHEGIETTVRLGIVSTAKYFTPRIVRSFLSQHPRYVFDLVIGNRREIIEALKTRAVDMAVMGRPPSEFSVEHIAIAPHPHVVIAPPDFTWDGKMERLEQEIFLVREEGSGTRKLFENYVLTHDHFEPVRRKPYGSNESIKQAVIAGLGIAFISASTIEHELETGQLKVLDLPDMPIIREWYIVHRSDEPLSTGARDFVDHLLSDRSAFHATAFSDPVL